MKKLFILILVSFITTISVAQSRYRGFVNTGYSFGSGEYGFSQWHINTVHGVDLFHNNLFIGGGIGLGISTESDILKTYSLPVFADVRYTLCNLKVKPYIDMKIGYSELLKKNMMVEVIKVEVFIFPPLPEYHCLSQKDFNSCWYRIYV